MLNRSLPFSLEVSICVADISDVVYNSKSSTSAVSFVLWLLFLEFLGASGVYVINVVFVSQISVENSVYALD